MITAMVFNATFNNISAALWWSAMVEKLKKTKNW
jgi:hypothetical protein